MPARDAEYAAEPPERLASIGNSQKRSNGTITSDIDIIDIRCDAIEMDLKVEIISMLKPAKGPRKMPTLLLYNDRGLQIFEKVGIAVFVMLWRLTTADNILGGILFDQC
jgi:hypothetical protein